MNQHSNKVYALYSHRDFKCSIGCQHVKVWISHKHQILLFSQKKRWKDWQLGSLIPVAAVMLKRRCPLGLRICIPPECPPALPCCHPTARSLQALVRDACSRVSSLSPTSHRKSLELFPGPPLPSHLAPRHWSLSFFFLLYSKPSECTQF